MMVSDEAGPGKVRASSGKVSKLLSQRLYSAEHGVVSLQIHPTWAAEGCESERAPSMGMWAGGQGVVRANARQEASSALLLPAKAPAPAQVVQTCIGDVSLLNSTMLQSWLELGSSLTSLTATLW